MASKIIRSGFKSQIKQTFATRDKAVPSGSNGIFSTLSLMNKGNQKETQQSCYKDFSPRLTTRRSENKGPLRSLNAGPSVKPTSIITESSSVHPSNTSLVGRFFDSVETTKEQAKQSAIAALAASRRILRTSTLQLFPRRRYGSSSNSKSACNIFQRHDDRRRVTKSKRIKDPFEGRALSTGNADRTALGILSKKLLEPLRNQNMSSPLGSLSQAFKVSSMIQEELMPVDKTMRERISVQGGGVAQNEPNEIMDPMVSWHHPPSPEILSNRIMERLVERRQAPSLADKPSETPRKTTTTTTTTTSTSSSGSTSAYRKRRLDMQCKEPTENPSPSSKVNATVPKITSSSSPPILKKKTAAESQTRLEVPSKSSTTSSSTTTAGDGGNSKENTTTDRTSNLTARRVINVTQGPVRRFSLRRPPKNKVSENVPPAPGPAAESLNQIKSISGGNNGNNTNINNNGNVSGTRPTATTEFSLKRYSGPGGNWF